MEVGDAGIVAVKDDAGALNWTDPVSVIETPPIVPTIVAVPVVPIVAGEYRYASYVPSVLSVAVMVAVVG